MTNLTAISLFAGIGGFDLALENNGVKVVAQVEINTKAQQVLKKRFPNSKLFSDVTQITGKELIDAGFKPNSGIITGGFPCQDLSVAGRRAGLKGERSGLFWEIARLLKETKAKYFIIENVPGLLTSQRGRDMGIVITTLVELGYSVGWRVLDAQYFGVPQRRKRVFIVGNLGDRTGPSKILFNSRSSVGDFGENAEKKQSNFRSPQAGVRAFIKTKRAQSVNDNENWIEANLSPTLNAFDIGDKRATALVVSNSVRRLTPMEWERLQGFPDNWTEGQAETNRYKQVGNAVAVPVVDWIVKGLVNYDGQ